MEAKQCKPPLLLSITAGVQAFMQGESRGRLQRKGERETVAVGGWRVAEAGPGQKQDLEAASRSSQSDGAPG